MSAKARLLLPVLVAALLLSACAVGTPTPTTPPTIPSPTATPAPTATAAAASPTATPPSGPTPTPAPTATLAPTVTLAPTPTPILPELPAWVMDDVGIGTTYVSLRYLVGQDFTGGETPLPAFRLSNGKVVHFEYDGTMQFSRIVRIQIDGSSAKLPKPDATPVPDFQIEKSGLVLAPISQKVRVADVVAAYGTPIDDTTILLPIDGSFSDPSQMAVVYARTLRYPGLTVGLAQRLGASDTTLWYIRSLEITSAAYPTPRGLKTGMTVRAILDLFATGTFTITSNGYEYHAPGIQSLLIETNEGYSILVQLKDGIAARIEMGGPGDN